MQMRRAELAFGESLLERGKLYAKNTHLSRSSWPPSLPLPPRSRKCRPQTRLPPPSRIKPRRRPSLRNRRRLTKSTTRNMRPRKPRRRLKPRTPTPRKRRRHEAMSACLRRGHIELCSISRVFERTPSVASLQGRALCLRPLTKKRRSRTAPRPSITRRAIMPPPLRISTKPTATPPRRTLRPAQLIPRARARNRSKRGDGVQPLQTVAEDFEHRSAAGGTR